MGPSVRKKQCVETFGDIYLDGGLCTENSGS